MKKIVLFLLQAFLAVSIFSESYQIADDVLYESNGITRPYALKKAVSIDFNRIFESYEELNSYLTDLKQQFNNQRVLSNAIINNQYDFEPNDDGIVKVHLRILTDDSNHFLAVPYPKYKSGDGTTIKLKMKDTNFLGTMEELNFDINYKNEEDTGDHIFGMNFSYDYPFELGPVDASWNNSFGIDFTLGDTDPEYNFQTGFTFVLPFNGFDLQFDMSQKVTKEFPDKDEPEKIGDELYYTTDFKFSIPLTIAKIDGWGSVKYTPYIDYTWNWDKDGINKENDDLSSPTLTVGHTVSTSRVNWYGNFRKGLSFDFGTSMGYNYQREHYIPAVEATFKGYYSFKYIGFNTRLNTFARYNSDKSIGSDLRGIRDGQKYKSRTGFGNQKSLSVPAAIVWSIDIPVHVITTDWDGWIEWIFGKHSWMADHFRWTDTFDFEMQMAPFGDLALTYNYATDRAFNIADGFYAGGLEVLVYPKKWRSLVVRASAGMDAGRKIVSKLPKRLIKFDNSWRAQCSALELYIGIGLQY